MKALKMLRDKDTQTVDETAEKKEQGTQVSVVMDTKTIGTDEAGLRVPAFDSRPSTEWTHEQLNSRPNKGEINARPPPPPYRPLMSKERLF